MKNNNIKVTIVGGGNIGTQFAVHCSQIFDTTLFVSKINGFSNILEIVDESDKIILTSKKINVTDDESLAFKDADIIFITYPAFVMSNVVKKIYPYVSEKTYIGLIPGTGGGECQFKCCMEKGATIFGLQRVPSVARLVQKGKRVKAAGYRDGLFVASIPKSKCDEIAQIIQRIFNIKCSSLPNYLNVTLTPSNPILHTTRLRTIFKDYRDGVSYDELPLFYEDWSNESTELLFKCDEEVQNICKSLDMFDLKYVKSLKEHYENSTVEGFTNKLRSIDSLKGLSTPSICVDNKYLPDFSNRYFISDFSYGLTILLQIGKIMGVDVKNIEETMNWYRNLCPNINEFKYSDYGINSKKDLIDFYNK